MNDETEYPYYRVVVEFLPHTGRTMRHSYAPLADYVTNDGLLQFKYQDDKRVVSIPVSNILETEVFVVASAEEDGYGKVG